jgi:hypothetical protein
MKKKPPDLFDPIEARAARDEAVAQVDENANEAWRAFMQQCLVWVAQTLPRLTSDDVQEFAARYPERPRTHENRAFGPIMSWGLKNKIIVPANVAPIPSRRKSLHASPRRVWDSLIYKKR